METANYLGFLALVVVILITPGPSVTLGVVHGMTYGARKAAITALGDITANLLQMAAAVAGLGLILSQSAVLFNTIKILGVLYLAYLGVKMLLKSFAKSNPVDMQIAAQERSSFWFFRQGFTVAITSPKAILFYGALFPQFILPEFDLLPQFLLLAMTCAILDYLIVVGYAMMAQLGASKVANSNTRWIDRLGGVMMLGTAAMLARAQR